MAKDQLSFFATKADLKSLLRSLLSESPLRFVRGGLFDSPRIESVLLSASHVENLDVGTESQTAVYLVLAPEIPVEVRRVPQRTGSVKYAVDQLSNPASVVLRPGSSFGNDCLVAGQVGTTSRDPTSAALYSRFSKLIRQQFTKVKSFYVGREAGELLAKGWRLTANAKSPSLYDLRR